MKNLDRNLFIDTEYPLAQMSIEQYITHSLEEYGKGMRKLTSYQRMLLFRQYNAQTTEEVLCLIAAALRLLWGEKETEAYIHKSAIERALSFGLPVNQEAKDFYKL